jgi:hypothetical protein
MKHKCKHGSILLLMLLGLSGCAHRVVDWATDCFTQAEDFGFDVKRAEPYIQSMTVYDELATEGMFDVLWLSDSVRAVYTDLFGIRRGRNEEFKQAFLRRQIEENKHFIIFYVLSPYEFKVGDNKSKWMVFVTIDDKIAQPIEVKTVDLDPEYQSIFGKRYSRFKEVYFVKFDAKDAEEKPILKEDSQIMQLVFRSLEKEVRLQWNLQTLPNLLPITQK